MHLVPGRSWRWPLVAAFLAGGILPTAAEEMRILGQVTQGEVNDITRGALMDAPDAVAPPPAAMLPPPEAPRLPDEMAALSVRRMKRGNKRARFDRSGFDDPSPATPKARVDETAPMAHEDSIHVVSRLEPPPPACRRGAPALTPPRTGAIAITD